MMTSLNKSLPNLHLWNERLGRYQHLSSPQAGNCLTSTRQEPSFRKHLNQQSYNAKLGRLRFHAEHALLVHALGELEN
jgi:hypothetical protein